jgi:ABC-2 type transport system permease protein
MRILVIARLTFLEAVRRRILLAGFLLGVAFLILYGAGFTLMRNEVILPSEAPLSGLFQTGFYSFLTVAGLYAVNFLAIAMGVLISADTLAGEISSGTIQAIVTKPMRRAEIVLGKWLGFAGLLALYLLLMAGGVLAIAYVVSGYTLPNLSTSIGLVYLEAMLMMTVTLALSSTLSTLATGGVIFGLYGIAFIGGWVEQFGSLVENQTAINVGIVSSLIIPSEALWRRAAYEMTPQVIRSLGGLGFASGGPFVTLSVPSTAMIVYAGIYLLAALAIAARLFSTRDL